MKSEVTNVYTEQMPSLKKIEKYNAGVTMCLEKTCSSRPIYFAEVDYHGLKLHICLCEEHADEALNNWQTQYLEK